MVGTISWILVIVGALNWGLVGIGGFLGMDLNLVAMIFGFVPVLESLVYVLVGAAAVYQLVASRKGSASMM